MCEFKWKGGNVRFFFYTKTILDSRDEVTDETMMTAHLLDKESCKDLNDGINDLGFSSQNDELQPIKSESK